MLSRLRRGEQFVVVAGGFLLLSLFFFPWHRLPSGYTITALQKPNSIQGTVAFLVTAGMVAQVVMARYANQKVNPNLTRLQPAAGLAVLGVLAWKLAAETLYLSVGAYLGILLAGALAYGGLMMARESGSPR